LLLNDSGLRSRMGAAGRARVVARFDYRFVARKLAAILSAHLGVV
jgi:glycosyltransferase involved in cell wall biosynthesis